MPQVKRSPNLVSIKRVTPKNTTLALLYQIEAAYQSLLLPCMYAGKTLKECATNGPTNTGTEKREAGGLALSLVALSTPLRTIMAVCWAT